MKKITAIVAIALLAAGAVFAGGGQDKGAASKGAAASGENTLVMYSPNTDTLINGLIPVFEKETGIKVQVISMGTGDCWSRIKSEAANPQADVQYGGELTNFIPDLLMPYVSKNNDGVLKQYQNIDGCMTPYCLDGSVLLVNNDQIGNIQVTGYADLLNPALKGKIIFGDPTTSSSAFAQLTNMLYDMGGGDYLAQSGWDYFSKLEDNLQGKVAQSSSIVHKSTADGEYAVGLTYEDPSATYVRDGSPVHIVYMKEGVSYNAALTGIIKNCKHPDAAKKWIDFIVSKEAQDIIGTQTTVRPVRGDATLASYMTPFNKINIIVEDAAKVTQLKPQILDKYRAIMASKTK
jgi:iron(III) transport system substrate-binding protein